MRTEQRQIELLRQANAKPWEVTEAIYRAKDIEVADINDMIRCVHRAYFKDAWDDYRALDTNVRDKLMDIIQKALYGTPAQSEQKTENSPFTDDELSLLSDALILAIQENSEAMKHITSGKAKAALNGHIDVLSYLNTKVCNMMKED